MAVSGRKTSGLSASILAGSTELYDFFCEPCNNDDKHLPAEGYCRDCKEYLCGTCFKYHRQPSVTRHHVLLDKTQMPKDKKPTKSNTMDVCTDQCPYHARKTTEYYCKLHDRLGCSACMTLSHRGCTGVSYIPDIADGIEKTQDYKHLKQKLDDLEQNAEQNKNKAKDNSKLVDTNSNEAVTEIREFRKKINKLFDTLENAMYQKVKAIRDEDIAATTIISDDCNSVGSDIRLMTADLENKLKAKQYSQLFVAVKKAEKEVNSIKDKVNRINNDNKIRQYKFEHERQLTDLVSNLTKLGNLTVITNIQDDASGTNISIVTKPLTKDTKGRKASNTEKQNITTETNPQINDIKSAESSMKPLMKDAKGREAKHARGINVRLQTDTETPDITGIAVLSDGRLAVADFSNCAIKVIDVKNNQITSHPSSLRPWDVTEVTKGQVAFTLCGMHKITFLTVSKTPYTAHDITVSGQCRGIEHYQGRLIVTFNNPGKVEIMDTNGTLFQRFTTDSSGAPMFVQPQYLAISRDGNTIYVSDCNKSFTSLTRDGQVKAKYNSKGARGLAIDRFGSVYVCDFFQSNVSQLTPDLNHLQQLLGDKDGVVKPSSITYCDKKNKLYVGMESDHIKEGRPNLSLL